MSKHLQTQFTETKRTGSNTEQGVGGGNATRATGAQRGGRIPAVVSTRAPGGSHTTPRTEDVQGRRTPERGGQSRIGHQPHNPAEAKGKAGNSKQPRKDF